ncbi:MAG: 3-isopropylmalate dehydratase small subunit [Pseudomonadota bacterium]
MAGWTRHTGKVALLAQDNLDTDQLLPARFMSTPRSEGYGDRLLYDVRRDESGALLPGFPLNRQPNASILVAGRNFGSGSSREAAVYALVDSGIRVVIAASFGDIFAANAVNNGLLPATVVEGLAPLGAAGSLTVDLQTCEISAGALCVRFTLDEGQRTKLINGWDDIDLTRHHQDEITAFRTARRQSAPWAWPAAG